MTSGATKSGASGHRDHRDGNAQRQHHDPHATDHQSHGRATHRHSPSRTSNLSRDSDKPPQASSPPSRASSGISPPAPPPMPSVHSPAGDRSFGSASTLSAEADIFDAGDLSFSSHASTGDTTFGSTDPHELDKLKAHYLAAASGVQSSPAYASVPMHREDAASFDVFANPSPQPGLASSGPPRWNQKPSLNMTPRRPQQLQRDAEDLKTPSARLLNTNRAVSDGWVTSLRAADQGSPTSKGHASRPSGDLMQHDPAPRPMAQPQHAFAHPQFGRGTRSQTAPGMPVQALVDAHPHAGDVSQASSGGDVSVLLHKLYSSESENTMLKERLNAVEAKLTSLTRALETGAPEAMAPPSSSQPPSVSVSPATNSNATSNADHFNAFQPLQGPPGFGHPGPMTLADLAAQTQAGLAAGALEQAQARSPGGGSGSVSPGLGLGLLDADLVNSIQKSQTAAMNAPQTMPSDGHSRPSLVSAPRPGSGSRQQPPDAVPATAGASMPLPTSESAFTAQLLQEMARLGVGSLSPGYPGTPQGQLGLYPGIMSPGFFPPMGPGGAPPIPFSGGQLSVPGMPHFPLGSTSPHPGNPMLQRWSGPGVTAGQGLKPPRSPAPYMGGGSLGLSPAPSHRPSSDSKASDRPAQPETTSVASAETLISRALSGQSQEPSIMLQQQLKAAPQDRKDAVIAAMRPHLVRLAEDKHCNFLVQRALGVDPDMAWELQGSFVKLSLSQFGCHVVQRVLDEGEELKTAVVDELLSTSVQQTLTSRNSIHVWQKVLELQFQRPEPRCRIFEVVNATMKGKWAQTAMLETGSIICQNVFESGNAEEKKDCIDEILERVCDCAANQWGVWVVQHIIEHGEPHHRATAFDKLATQAVPLTLSQYGQKAIMSALKTKDASFLAQYIDAICDPETSAPSTPATGEPGEATPGGASGNRGSQQQQPQPTRRSHLVDIGSTPQGLQIVAQLLTSVTPQQRERVIRTVRRNSVSLKGSKSGLRVHQLCERARAYAGY